MAKFRMNARQIANRYPRSITATEGHTLTYSVAPDADNVITLWVETTDDGDWRFIYGPQPVMVKEKTDINVWNAACRVLVGGK